jgi:ABC-2 type transport system permease protein
MAMMGGGFQDELTERIRTGDVAIDLYRPADLQTWWLAADCGRAAFHLLGRGIVPLLCGALFFDLALPANPLTWVLFLLSAAAGIVVSFAIRYLVVLTAFWLLDGAGVTTVAGLATMFFSGTLLPLNVFPGALGDIARLLPWAALLQIPADILLGVSTGPATLARSFGFQIAWAVALLAAGRALQAVATRKVVVQGG